MSAKNDTIIVGAVAAGPPVVTIWAGFKKWLNEQGLPFDFVLYSTYQRQVEELVAGRIHAAWNSPSAWIKARRLAEQNGARVANCFMRDVDFDTRSVIAVREDGGIDKLEDLKGRNVAVGSPDSAESTTMPFSACLDAGVVPGEDFEVRFCSDVLGLDGGDQQGEVDAARLLAQGEADAACLAEANYQALLESGTIPAGATKVLVKTEPYDHCNMSVNRDVLAEDAEARLYELFLRMPHENPELRPCMDLEAVKEWKPPRDSHYESIERALDAMAKLDVIKRRLR